MKRFSIFLICISVGLFTAFAEPQLFISVDHGASINCTAYSPDGKYIATASDDSTVRVWDSQTGIQLRIFDHGEEVHAVSWSCDGVYLFSISAKEVSLWNVAEDKKISSIKTEWAKNIACSPVDSYVAYIDGSIHVCNYKKGEWIEIRHPSSYDVESVHWSPDGKYIVSAGNDSTIRVWDIKAKKEVGVFTGHSDRVRYACFSPDGKKIASVSADGSARVWDVQTQKELYRLQGTYNSLEAKISWSPNGKYISTYSNWDKDTQYDSKFRLFNAKNGSLIYEHKDSGAGLSFYSWSNDSNCVAVGNGPDDRVTNVKRISDGKNLITFSNQLTDINSIELNRDNSYLIVDSKIGNSSDAMLNIFDTQTGAIVGNIKHKTMPSFVWSPTFAWNPAGDSIVFKNSDGKLTINELHGSSDYVGDNVKGDLFCWSNNNRYIACGQNISKSGDTEIFDVTLRKIVKVLSGSGSSIAAIQFSIDSKYLICGTYDGSVLIWNVADWSLHKTLDLKECIRSLAWNPYKNYMAITTDKEIFIYDTVTWEKENIEFKESGFQFSSCWSSDGNYLVTAGIQKKVRIWNSLTGELVRSLGSHLGYVTSLAITENSCFVYSGGTDGIVALENLNTGEVAACTCFGINNEWITLSCDGYFTGTDWAIKKTIYFIDGMKTIGMEQLIETFYRPDLVAARLRGEDISSLEQNDVKIEKILEAGEPPFVQFGNTPSSSANRDLTINFSVQDQGGGIGSVYLSHNGKVIQVSNDTRKLELHQSADSAKKQGQTLQFSQSISLSDGDNIIEAYATNAAGKIESRHVSTTIAWHGETAKPNLFVFALAVNDYNSRSVSKLKYAVPDALSVVKIFSEKSDGGMYKKVTTHFLFDDEVTKPRIQKEIDALAKTIRPDDVFVFYISGHGAAYNGDYYFISYDFNGSDISTAVSKEFILEQLSKISASKTVLLLDTCNSGAIVNGGGGDSNTAFARLSHKTGQAIIAASSDTQTAMEGYEGHGVFTYALIDALSGKADFINDNKISLQEVNLYVSNFVPMISKLKWNHRQNPWCDLRGQDFVLVGK